MLRVIAFVSGVVAALAVLLLVVAGLSHKTLLVASKDAKTVSVDVRQDSGEISVRPVDPQADKSISGEDEPDDGSQIDIEGDEVTPAVAQYRFDAQGNIYETHAPHTEVPHLGSPQM